MSSSSQQRSEELHPEYPDTDMGDYDYDYDYDYTDDDDDEDGSSEGEERRGDVEMDGTEYEYSMMEDSDEEEVGSQYDSLYSSGSDATTTIASEVTNFRFENGRRYHSYSEGSYWAPNDDRQNNQLDMFHQVFLMVENGDLFQCPIMYPRRVLDLGTGTGIWAIDMADRYPEAQVLGNDLSPIQPLCIPPNCTFEVDDFTKPWLHPPKSFDLIHARTLAGSVPDWPALLAAAYETLQPGGWFESAETTTYFFSDKYPNSQLPPGHGLREWGDWALRASELAGKPFGVPGKISGMMKKAGFVNIVEKIYKVPIGPWPKDKKMKLVGKLNLVNFVEGAEGFSLALATRVLGWSVEQMNQVLDVAINDMKDKTQANYVKLYVTYGQRAMAEDTPGMGDADSGFFTCNGLKP